ncbi:MAG: PAS domain-containing protein [Bryobacterales bacterium]|nr:PAS domain-containing protein [Bryobacterales bacterium]
MVPSPAFDGSYAHLAAMRTLADMLPYRIVIKDTEGRFLYVNQECCNAHRFATREDAYGKHDADIFEQGHVSQARFDEQQILATGMPLLDKVEFETRKDGRRQYVLTSKIPFNSPEGRFIFCIVKDITESTKELERYRNAISGTAQGIWVRELPSDEMWYSARYKEILGYADDDPEFPHTRAAWRSRVHPSDLPRVEAEIEKHLTGKSDYYDCTYRMRHKDGKYRHVRSRGKKKTDPSGQPTSMAGSHEDVTQQHELDTTYRKVMDHMPGMVWVKVKIGKEFHFAFVNQALAEAFGTNRKQILDKTDADFITDPEQLKRFYDDDEKVWSTKTPVIIRREVMTVKGVKRVLATVKIPFRSDAVMGMAIDISELETLTGRMQLLMESIPDGIFFKDLDGRFIEVNPALARVVKKTPKEIVDLTDRDLFGEPYASEARAEEDEIIRTGQASVNQRRETPTPDGVRIRLVTKTPLYNKDGQIDQICGVSKDITDLLQTDELMQKILTQIPLCVFVKDAHGKYLFCNLSFARRHGTDNPKDIIGKTDYDFWNKEDADRFRRTDREALESNQTHTFEERQTINGSDRTIETTKIPLSTGGVPDRVLGIYDDITERKENDKAIMNKQIAKTIGHSLKGWLVISDGILSVLKKRYPVLNSDKSFARLETAIRYLLESAIVATRIASLEGGVQPEDVQITDCVQEAIDGVGDPRVVANLPDRPIVCRGSRVHLRNAVLEVIENARRAIGDNRGQIAVTIAMAGTACRIVVEDDGPGIPDHVRKRLFELFNTGEQKGTGLGLAYVKRVCELFGGTARTGCDGDPPGLSLPGARIVLVLPTLAEET